jgi:hypothetical protein
MDIKFIMLTVMTRFAPLVGRNDIFPSQVGLRGFHAGQGHQLHMPGNHGPDLIPVV